MLIPSFQQMNKFIKFTVLVAALASMRLAYGEGESDTAPGYFLQDGTVYDMLEVIAKTEKTKIFVLKEDENALRKGISFALIAPISREVAMKVMRAILLTEGFELVAEGESLALKRILTEEQTMKLKKALGLKSDLEGRPPARRRSVQNGGIAPPNLIIMRENKYEKGTDYEKGADDISPPGNSRSAPRQPPEGPPPAKPGSAPR
jgi:hypothetical protein